jgi:segregation and condensation protein B
VRLSRAQLETLAIVAYRQPVTRPEVDDVRGVDSGQVIKGLLERDLVKILGKKDEPGRPMLYGTSAGFLELFNLTSLKDLPSLREFTELSQESRQKYESELGEDAPAGAITEESDSGTMPPAALPGEQDGFGTVAEVSSDSSDDGLEGVGADGELHDAVLASRDVSGPNDGDSDDDIDEDDSDDEDDIDEDESDDSDDADDEDSDDDVDEDEDDSDENDSDDVDEAHPESVSGSDDEDDDDDDDDDDDE